MFKTPFNNLPENVFNSAETSIRAGFEVAKLVPSNMANSTVGLL